MGIALKIKENNALISCWKIEESLEELLSLSSFKIPKNINNINRKKEWLASRILLEETQPGIILNYNDFGAPLLSNDLFISISHSKKLVMHIISNIKVGLDIEEISEKALRIAPKFIPSEKLKNLSKEKATLIWCLKEAIYKWHQKGGVDFIKDITIDDFNINNKGVVTAFLKGQELILNYQKINTHYLAYVCK